MTLVAFSMPCPSTSKACGMAPVLVTLNVMVPAAIVRCDSSTFHSDNVPLTVAGSSGVRRAVGVAASVSATRSPEALRDRTAYMELIFDLPPRSQMAVVTCQRLWRSEEHTSELQ